MTDPADHLLRTRNRQVRRVMFEWGADLAKMHEIEHFFLMSDRRRAEALAQAAQALGYQVGEIHEQEGDHETPLSLVITTKACPDSDELDQQTIRMAQLATEYECTYDGWGTLIDE